MIEQDAAQGANVTGGGNATSLSQLIEQDAAQGANVTGGGGGPTILDQLINKMLSRKHKWRMILKRTEPTRLMEEQAIAQDKK